MGAGVEVPQSVGQPQDPGNSGQSVGDTGGRPAPGALMGTGCFTLAMSRCGCW